MQHKTIWQMILNSPYILPWMTLMSSGNKIYRNFIVSGLCCFDPALPTIDGDGY